MPRLAAIVAVESGTPACDSTHAMIAAESLPSARITERSIASPPEGCGRARRLTVVRIVSSSTG
jgi:hypothetical protein